MLGWRRCGTHTHTHTRALTHTHKQRQSLYTHTHTHTMWPLKGVSVPDSHRLSRQLIVKVHHGTVRRTGLVKGEMEDFIGVFCSIYQ